MGVSTVFLNIKKVQHASNYHTEIPNQNHQDLQSRIFNGYFSTDTIESIHIILPQHGVLNQLVVCFPCSWLYELGGFRQTKKPTLSRKCFLRRSKTRL